MKDHKKSSHFVAMRQSLLLLSVITLFLCKPIFGQIRSGASFLKMLPGARLHAMSECVTAGLDEPHAIYANPGAAGFLREWQWAATYTKWIADVYNASLIYGMRLRTPWSPITRVALGVFYQGMPEFDSSDGATPAVTANDVLLSASLGQPLSFISNNVALGINAKYLKSSLAQFDASSWMVDTGILYRTPKFRFLGDGFGLFKYGIFSAGLSVTNLGSSLTFISTETPLPRTFRGGIAFNTGTHDGLQFQISLDYFKVRDEEGRFGVGTELSWSRLFALTAGYDHDRDLLERATIGLSLSLDDFRLPASSPIPGPSKAIRFDLATLDEEEFLSRTYRGGLTHYNIGPEAFRFINPPVDALIDADSTTLVWEPSRDPDLYDDVWYYLLVARDSLKLIRIIENIDTGNVDFPLILKDSILFINQQLNREKYQLTNLAGGDYYWSVIAFDKDNHLRFAESHGRRIAHFYIPYPDLVLTNIEFKYSPWITTDDYQGKLELLLTNKGEATAREVTLVITDTLAAVNMDSLVGLYGEELLMEKVFDEIRPNETKLVEMEWHTVKHGLHHIIAQVDTKDTITELDESNNSYVGEFYSIPKGTFAAEDTVNVLLSLGIQVDLPLINEINMDSGSTEVKSYYLHKTVFDPPLGIIASRLKEFQHIQTTLQGFSDPSSETASTEFSNARAVAVRDSLLLMGVKGNQMMLFNGQVLPLRQKSKNPIDERWVSEERRYVRVNAEGPDQKILFAPVPHLFVDEIKRSVKFDSDIHAALVNNRAMLYLENSQASDSINIYNNFVGANLTGDVHWTTNVSDSVFVLSWLGRNITYSISVVDSLVRMFRTKPQVTYLSEEDIFFEYRLSFPLRFANTSPTYDFYWDRIYSIAKEMYVYPNMRLRFEGHACAIGPASINQRLSEERAKAFLKGFLNYIKTEHSEDYKEFSYRVDPAVGYGESTPLQIEKSNGEVILIGDNDIPIGRKFNRRIEIVFYSTKGGLKKGYKK